MMEGGDGSVIDASSRDRGADYFKYTDLLGLNREVQLLMSGFLLLSCWRIVVPRRVSIR